MKSVFVILVHFSTLACNVLGIAEGGEIVAQMLSSAPQLAKPFLFANLHFSKQIKNGFCGIEVQKLKFELSAPLLAIPCYATALLFILLGLLALCCVGLVALLQFLRCAVGLCELQMCHQKPSRLTLNFNNFYKIVKVTNFYNFANCMSN